MIPLSLERSEEQQPKKNGSHLTLLDVEYLYIS